MSRLDKTQVRIARDVVRHVKQSAKKNGRTVPLEVNHVLRGAYAPVIKLESLAVKYATSQDRWYETVIGSGPHVKITKTKMKPTSKMSHEAQITHE